MADFLNLNADRVLEPLSADRAMTPLAAGDVARGCRARAGPTCHNTVSLCVNELDVDAQPVAGALSVGLIDVAEREVYAALDWLIEQQTRIEAALAKKHLTDGTLVLYDVSSSYMEGRCCALAKPGYSRDHRPDRPQIVYGLLCAPDGTPVAVEVFEGNTSDPQTIREVTSSPPLRTRASTLR